MHSVRLSALLIVVLGAANGLGETLHTAGHVPRPTEKEIEYSPYPGENFPNQIHFGDTHLHTSYSAHAGMVGATIGPEEDYRFALGEEVKSNYGVPVRLQRPLDFLVIADHAENLGLATMISESNPTLLKSEWAKKIHDLVKAGKGLEAFDMWVKAKDALKDPLA